MPHAVKLSDALVEEARVAADLENRSVASQIEHWARLGRVVEQDLAAPARQELALHAAADRAGAGSLASRIGEALDAALRPAAREAFAAELASRVRYGTDPAFPDPAFPWLGWWALRRRGSSPVRWVSDRCRRL